MFRLKIQYIGYRAKPIPFILWFFRPFAEKAVFKIFLLKTLDKNYILY